MPRKRPTASALREPLAYALGTPAKVATLRALAGAGGPITQRDVARRAGVQHRSIQLALDDLVRLAIVTRVEGGRDYLVRFNCDHRLAPALLALFTGEAGHFLALRSHLSDITDKIGRRTRLVSVVLFGSVARSADGLDSDCDLLVVARDAAGLGAALSAFESATEEIRLTYGCRLAPVGYVAKDAQRRWRDRTLPFADVRRDGFVLFGPSLGEGFGD